jgi:uncharacterized protein (TIGR02284 family)
METIMMLDRLIATCVDSEKRYHRAAKDVGKANFGEFLERQSEIRKRAADELQAERTRLGAVGDEAGTWAGVADRRAMDFSVVMSMGDTGVVNWCREGAEATATEYENALREDLTPHLRGIIQRQLGEVRTTIAGLDNVLNVYGGLRS